jgi:cytochrome c-type biogenesis protein
MATWDGQSVKVNRWSTFSHGIAFVLGFSIVFVLLGLTGSVLGGLLYNMRSWLAKIGGLVVIVFGIHMTGLYRIPFLDYDLRPQNNVERRRSYLSSALMGIFFSAGWSPCVGPVLGAILTMAIYGGSAAKGVQLLSSYSAGLAIPFLLAALGIGWVTMILWRFQKVMHIAEIVMGILMIVVGVLLFLGTYQSFSRFGFFVDFGL